LLERRGATRRHRVRKTRTTLVEQDDATERRKTFIKRHQPGTFPEQLQVADPPRDTNEIERSVTKDLVRDVSSVVSNRILNPRTPRHDRSLTGTHEHRSRRPPTPNRSDAQGRAHTKQAPSTCKRVVLDPRSTPRSQIPPRQCGNASRFCYGFA